ncbi:MAG: PAS domain S-box protein, partial [Gammaproteobacteria bacterium]|nr:PAS domain S-box protein [Gammaproteobacteria bacterium]
LDITERKHIEGDLRELSEKLERRLATGTTDVPESEPRLRAIVDAVSEAILTIDEHGVIGDLNRAAEATFGYTADEAVGCSVSLLMPLPRRDEHGRHLRRCLESGEPRPIGEARELEGQRKDGTTFPMTLTLSEIDRSGR